MECAVLPNSLSEASRLARLHQLGILDTEEDPYFRTLAEQALAIVPGTTIAALTLIDADRQWCKAIIGSSIKSVPRSMSICSHTIQGSGVMVVENATLDARFVDNPIVTMQGGVRFYVGAKLMDGVGALCVIGLQPRRAAEDEIAKLEKLAGYANIRLLAHGALHQLADQACA